MSLGLVTHVPKARSTPASAPRQTTLPSAGVNGARRRSAAWPLKIGRNEGRGEGAQALNCATGCLLHQEVGGSPLGWCGHLQRVDRHDEASQRAARPGAWTSIEIRSAIRPDHCRSGTRATRTISTSPPCSMTASGIPRPTPSFSSVRRLEPRYDLDLAIIAYPSMARSEVALRHMFRGCQVIVPPPVGTTGLVMRTSAPGASSRHNPICASCFVIVASLSRSVETTSSRGSGTGRCSTKLSWMRCHPYLRQQYGFLWR